MLKVNSIIVLFMLAALITGCDDKPEQPKQGEPKGNPPATTGGGTHGHAHDETDLGKFDIQGMQVEAAQGHGKVEAGKEGHLVIKLPYKDDGATVVRAWIGTSDRTLSSVGKGEYAPSHDDYDIHTVAPDPLPADAKWWLEVEKPDGTKAVGSIPLLKDIQASS